MTCVCGPYGPCPEHGPKTPKYFNTGRLVTILAQCARPTCAGYVAKDGLCEDCGGLVRSRPEQELSRDPDPFPVELL